MMLKRIFLIWLLLLWPLFQFMPETRLAANPQGAIFIGQNFSAGGGGGGPTTATMFGTGCTSGGGSCNWSATPGADHSLLVFMVGTPGSTLTITTTGSQPSCVDLNTSDDYAGVAQGKSCLITNTVANTTEIACASSSSVDQIACSALEITGGTGGDQTAVNHDSSASGTGTAGSVTTSAHANEMIVGMFGSSLHGPSVGASPGSGYTGTTLVVAASEFAYIEWKIVSSTSTYQPTFTYTSNTFSLSGFTATIY